MRPIIIIIIVLLTLTLGFLSVRAQAEEKHVVKGPVKHIKGDTMVLGNKAKPFEKVPPKEQAANPNTSLPQSSNNGSHSQTNSPPRERAWFPHPCRLTNFMGWLFWIGLVLLVLAGVTALGMGGGSGGVLAGIGLVTLILWLVILLLPILIGIVIVIVVLGSLGKPDIICFCFRR